MLVSPVKYVTKSMDLESSTNASYVVTRKNETDVELSVALEPSNRSCDVIIVKLERFGSVTVDNNLTITAKFAPADYPSAPEWLPASSSSTRTAFLYKQVLSPASPSAKKSRSQGISGLLIAVCAVGGVFLLTTLLLAVVCVWKYKHRTCSGSLKEVDPMNVTIQVLKPAS